MDRYGNAFLIFGILAVIWGAILIYTYIGIYKRKDLSFLGKLIWIMIIFAAPVAGLLVYLFIGKKHMKHQFLGRRH
ncbi:PLDc N-terminal domain-containing protein [Paraflavisolibacter sp. H34]|uniref:PLDc N-terminal domain-containing protein n=1 Tax=Huijunlia imazamoxiresistens TaxID=3127457 RepID=UPI003019A0AD